jgi:hypothetical protein
MGLAHVAEKTVQNPNYGDDRSDGQQDRAGPANPVEPPWLRLERFWLDNVVVCRPGEIGRLVGQRGGG